MLWHRHSHLDNLQWVHFLLVKVQYQTTDFHHLEMLHLWDQGKIFDLSYKQTEIYGSFIKLYLL